MAHVAVVDLTNKSVSVLDGARNVVCAIGPGITRSNAAAALALHGWALAGAWELTSPPDGFSAAAYPIKERK